MTMGYLFFAIICSLSVSLLFKYTNPKVDWRQSIATNYAIAAILCVCWLWYQNAWPVAQDLLSLPWLTLSVLSMLLPGVFLMMRHSIVYVGLARSEAAQRLSLVIPLIAAFTLYQQSFSSLKGVGIICALLAVFALTHSNHRYTHQRQWFYLIIVWLGYGLADLMFKRMALTGGLFISALAIVFTLALLLTLSYLKIKTVTWHSQSILMGLPLGLLNFANIYCYIRAHQVLPKDPALVFASMNIGVIIGGLILGILLFSERLSHYHWLGILTAIPAVLLLAYG